MLSRRSALDSLQLKWCHDVSLRRSDGSHIVKPVSPIILAFVMLDKFMPYRWDISYTIEWANPQTCHSMLTLSVQKWGKRLHVYLLRYVLHQWLSIIYQMSYVYLSILTSILCFVNVSDILNPLIIYTCETKFLESSEFRYKLASGATSMMHRTLCSNHHGNTGLVHHKLENSNLVNGY